jgi:two-component system, chemotaxis family, sensor kinase CheA
MDNREEEFLKRLKNTFRIESDEHVQTISSGLLNLDKNPSPQDKAQILETIYREAHSLKGAARAVGMRDVEKVCQAMETVFSMLKKDEIQAESWILDVLMDSIEGASKLVTSEEAIPIVELLHRLSQIIENSAESQNELEDVKKDFPSSDVATNPNHPTVSIGTEVIYNNSKTEISDPENKTFDAEEEVSQRKEPEIVVLTPQASIKGTLAAQSQPNFNPHACVPGAPSEPKRLGQSETIRIKTSKLDSLLYQVEEMVSIKMAANQRASDLRNLKSSLDLQKKQWLKIYPEVRILKNLVETLEARDAWGTSRSYLLKMIDFLEANEDTIKGLESKLKTINSMAENDSRQAASMVNDLLDDMKSVLMLPSSTLLEILPRLVRDLARDQGKKIKLTIEGGDTEIDRRILEEMKDPLIHLARNSIDHGLERPTDRTRRGKTEEGSLAISIAQLGTKKVEILVADDGAGIDVEKVKQAAIRKDLITEQELRGLNPDETTALIFKSEISTSPIITDLSGRGLGLAIVREKVEKLGGTVTVESRLGIGTVFHIQLPVTLATFRGTLVQVGTELFIVPTSNVIRVSRVRRDSIGTVENRDTITMKGRVLPLVRLADVLEIKSEPKLGQASEFVTVLILGASDQKIAFSVNAILNEQEVLVKSLGRQLSRVRNVSAATVLGSGQVALILNVSDLILSAMRIAGVGLVAHTQRPEDEEKTKSILVVEDSITSRMLLKNILESAGYEVQTAVDGADAWSTLKTANFDLVVSDVEMPRMDGFELTAKIRSQEDLKSIPVVIVTSLESREDRERGIDVGANAYIVKSGFEQNNLLSVVKRLL